MGYDKREAWKIVYEIAINVRKQGSGKLVTGMTREKSSNYGTVRIREAFWDEIGRDICGVGRDAIIRNLNLMERAAAHVGITLYEVTVLAIRLDKAVFTTRKSERPTKRIYSYVGIPEKFPRFLKYGRSDSRISKRYTGNCKFGHMTSLLEVPGDYEVRWQSLYKKWRVPTRMNIDNTGSSRELIRPEFLLESRFLGTYANIAIGGRLATDEKVELKFLKSKAASIVQLARDGSAYQRPELV